MISSKALDLIAVVQRAIKESSIDTKEAPERMPRGQVIGEETSIEANPAASTESVSSPDDGVKTNVRVA